MSIIEYTATSINDRLKAWRKGRPVHSPVSITAHQFRSFKYCLTAIVLLSVAAGCIENGLHPLVLVTIPVIIVALFRADYGRTYLWSERATTIVFAIYAVIMGLAIVLFHRRLPFPVLIVYFTFGTILARVLSRLNDRNIAQLIFLTVGMILINCILTNHLMYGLILPVYLFALMSTLALFDAARSKQAAARDAESLPEPRTSGVFSYFGKITVGVVGLSALVFVVLPRPYVMFPALRAAMVNPAGFAEMEKVISYRDILGQAGRERIAFTVDVEDGELPDHPYWRGRVLEHFDGRNWKAGPSDPGVPRFTQLHPSLVVTYRFTPYKLQSNTIYVVGLPFVVKPGALHRPLYITPNYEVMVDSPFLSANYYLIEAGKVPIPSHRRQLPANLRTTGITPRIQHLAREWTSGAATPADKAQALIDRFTNRFRYSLDVPAPPQESNPMEYFLFQTRAGHCEYFAGACCLMLRSLGIPARVVEGFSGMEPGGTPDQYVIRFANAHAWVEAVLGNKEWTILDPTPPASDPFGGRFKRQVTDFYDRMVQRWIKYVVYFDRSDQKAIRDALAALFEDDVPFTPAGVTGILRHVPYLAVMASFLLITLLLVAYRYRNAKRDPVTLYVATMRALVTHGVLVRVHPWHEGNRSEIEHNCPGARDAVSQFTNVYLQSRFGDRGSVSRKQLTEARDALLKSVKEETARAA